MTTEKMGVDQKLKKLRRLKECDDVTSLRQLAIERWGLVNKEYRCVVWPKLYDIKPEDIPPKPEQSRLRQHKDYEQVVLDVNRSLKRFPPGMDEDVRMSMQDQLVDLIMRVLVRNKDLHYYQGYHDICVTFLLVLDEDTAFALVERLSKTHFKLFMGPDMSDTSEHLQLIHVLLSEQSPLLTKRFEDACLQPLYALSWVITWFGHVLGDLDRILRVYDFFLGSDCELMPIYLSAALVLHCTEAVMSCEPDFALLHHCLSSLPSNDLPLEDLITSACNLFRILPPKKLLSRAMPSRAINGRAIGAAGDVHSARRWTANRLGVRRPATLVSVLVLVAAVLIGLWLRFQS